MAIDENTMSGSRSWLDRAQLAGVASLGAGAIHLSAAGIHAEHPTLARLFVVLGAVQIVAGLALDPDGWSVGVGCRRDRQRHRRGWLGGHAGVGDLVDRRPGGVRGAAVRRHGMRGARGDRRGAGGDCRHTRDQPGAARDRVSSRRASWSRTVSLAAMLAAATHVHSHGEDSTITSHSHDEASTDTGHAHDDASTVTSHGHDEAESTTSHAHEDGEAGASGAAAVDLSGVDGVTPTQQAFAEELVARTLRRSAAVGGPGGRRRRRLPLDRRRGHGLRALRPVGLARRRRLARPEPPREPRLRGAA